MATHTAKIAAFAFLTIAQLAGARSALAQTEEERARLREILHEAEGHMQAGRHARAAERYMDVYNGLTAAQSPRASVALWNVGVALTNLPGREEEAIATLRRFLDESTALAEDPEVRNFREQANEHIGELEARVRARGTSGSSADTSPTSQPESSGGISPIGPIILGVGGAALLTGAILGGVSLARAGDLDAMCTDGVCPDTAQAQSLHSEMLTFSNAADGLMIAGGVIAAVGLVLTFVLPAGQSESPATAGVACRGSGCELFVRGSM